MGKKVKKNKTPTVKQEAFEPNQYTEIKIQENKTPSIKEEVFEPNEYMEIEIDNYTDGCMSKDEEETFYVEVPPISQPIVCTTRLENMCIMQMYLKRRKPKNIIKKIYNESKNAYNNLRLGYNISCTCKKRKHNLSFMKLQKKLSFLSTNSKVLEDDKKGSKIEQTSVDFSSDDEVISCKVKRLRNESAASNLRDTLMEDSDDDKEVLEELVCRENILEDSANFSTLVQDLSTSLDLKVIDVMGIESNVIILIKNVYSHTTEIYVTDVNNTIFEFVTVQNDDYSFVYKMFNVSNCNEKPCNEFSKCLMQFTCCCWSKRRIEVKTRFSKEFTKFLSIPHSCSLKCSCCCNEEKEVPAVTYKQTVGQLDMNFNSTTNKLGEKSKICKRNQIIEAALKFEKPKKTWQNHITSSKKDQLQFFFNITLNLKCINSNKKPKKTNFTEHYEFAGVGEKREIVFHSFAMKSLDKIDKIVVSFKDTSKDACCNSSLNLALNEVSAKYALNQNVINYIFGIHKSNIFKDWIVQKCIACKYNNVKLAHASNDFKVVIESIEHIRKAIVGQIVTPKVHMLEQTKYMEEVSKTIQEMMGKLEGKFPSISFFINETGLPVASLPKPYHCYPLEDLKILTQVLEFAQRKITGQVPTVIYVPMKNTETYTIDGHLHSNAIAAQTICTIPEIDEQNNIESTKEDSYDSCTLMIKCNKISYVQSFQSFVDNSVRNEHIGMPTILNVCSLSENHEIARQINEYIVDDENKTITILDDDELIC